MTKAKPDPNTESDTDLDQVPVPPAETEIWTRQRLLKIVAIHIVAAGFGYLAFHARLPLPWMMGALATATFSTLVFQAPPPPRITRVLGQLVVGSGVGLYLTPDALKRIIEATVPILASSFLTIAAALLIAVIQTRLFGVRLPTSIFACIPGSPADMANMAERNNGDPAQVALAQVLRIVAIVTVFPPLLVLSGLHFDPFTPPLREISVAGLAIMFVISLAVGIFAARLHVVNPYFLAPMGIMGLLTVLDVHLSGLPTPLIACAQILLGVSIGSMFRRKLFRDHRASVTTFLSTVVLISASLCIAWVLSALFGLDIFTMALANAPGSVTEMTLTAKAMHLDVSLVAAFHLVRVFIVMALVPLLYAVAVRLSSGR